MLRNSSDIIGYTIGANDGWIGKVTVLGVVLGGDQGRPGNGRQAQGSVGRGLVPCVRSGKRRPAVSFEM
jgi:hypothetical protein